MKKVKIFLRLTGLIFFSETSAKEGETPTEILDKAAEITGIHRNTLSVYENNPKVIQLGKLFEILKKYGVDNDIFFGNICEYIHEDEKDNED